MIDTIYIERALADCPRSQRIIARFPAARRIFCERYGEVFNRSAQNFRLQKNRPALILAKKHGRTVLPTPAGYGIGGTCNYYFSHLLNCIYDCRYCFLQGMYRSAHYVLFSNYADFYLGIEQQLQAHPDGDVWFFSGYDCDSLALEPITGFLAETLDFFARHPRAHLELRTKSTQIRALLQRPPIPNCVVAFSLSPAAIVRALEHKTPSLQRRITALATLQKAGWQIGLRFDPLIYDREYRTLYTELFQQVFDSLDSAAIHSVCLGTFRLPRGFWQKMVTLYPREKLFAAKLHSDRQNVGYAPELAGEMLDFCSAALRQKIPADKLFISAQEDHAGA